MKGMFSNVEGHEFSAPTEAERLRRQGGGRNMVVEEHGRCTIRTPPFRGRMAIACSGCREL